MDRFQDLEIEFVTGNDKRAAYFLSMYTFNSYS